MNRSGYNFQHNSRASVTSSSKNITTGVPNVLELLTNKKNIDYIEYFDYQYQCGRYFFSDSYNSIHFSGTPSLSAEIQMKRAENGKYRNDKISNNSTIDTGTVDIFWFTGRTWHTLVAHQVWATSTKEFLRCSTYKSFYFWRKRGDITLDAKRW